MLYSGFEKGLAVKSSVRNMSKSDKVATHSDNRSHWNKTGIYKGDFFFNGAGLHHMQVQ